jgi:hypothetical protein
MLQPAWLGTEATIEDTGVTTPGRRREQFGQSDHVRIYGRDFLDRLESARFVVSLEHYARRLPPGQIELYGIRDQPIFVCAKSAATRRD